MISMIRDMAKWKTVLVFCLATLLLNPIGGFVPAAYFEIVATAEVTGGQFQMRHAPQDRIVRRESAQDAVKAAEGFEGVSKSYYTIPKRSTSP